VPALTGVEKIIIPPGTQTGSLFRLKGKGIVSLRGNGRGDQVIETTVTVPTSLNRRQEKLLKEFERMSKDERGS